MTQNHYFQAYAWPGNVRELKHTVECMAVIAEQGALSMGDLPEHLTNTTGNAAYVLLQLPEDSIDLEEVEREILRQSLERHGGNQTRAAQYLNITRSALIFRMQKFAWHRQKHRSRWKRVDTPPPSHRREPARWRRLRL